MATKVSIKRGDTVSQILKTAGVSSYGSKASWEAVRKANKLDSRYTIHSGNQLIIPDSLLGKASSKSKPSSKPKATSSATPPTSATVPQTTKELADFANDYQTQLNEIKDYDPFGGKTSIEAIDTFATDTLGVTGEAPVAPKYEATFEQLRQDMGLESIEAGINEYKAMIRDQENLLRQQRNSERGKTVGLGVIEGRIDQATRDRQEEISWLSSNVAFLTDTANSAYNYINMTMNFKQMDYNTAKELYDGEFNKRLAIYDSLVSQAREERNFKLQIVQEQQRVATAQLTMFTDMIVAGNLSFEHMSSEAQLTIHKLETQAGLPIGFVSQVKIPKGQTVESITRRTDPSGNVIADIIYVDPISGAVTVKHQSLGKTEVASSGGGSGSSAVNKTIDNFLEALSKPDIPVASTRKQAEKYELEGVQWQSREDWIAKLTNRWGSKIDREAIEANVYDYFRDY